MNRYIKIRFVKDGNYISDKTYIYKTSLDVQLGETIQATPTLQGVITGFEVISNILKPETIKEIVGQIKKEDANG
jgi:hypothetical protein